MRRRHLLPRVSLHRPGIDVLTILCVTLIVAQAMVASAGGVDVLVQRGFYEVVGLSRPGILQGRVWQLVTYPFFHGSWVHLLINGLIIYMIGGRVIHILGGRGFARVFFGGVLVGGLAHLLLQPRLPVAVETIPANAPLVGASAGAMALLLVLTGLSPDSRMWPIMVSGKNLGRGLLLSTLILFVLTPGLNLPLLSTLGSWLAKQAGLVALFQISHICHFGGGLVGWLYARRLLRRPITLEELQRMRARKEEEAVARSA